MKRTISGLVMAVALAATLAMSFAWTGQTAVQAQETEPSAALNLDVTIETADGEIITLPLQIDEETFSVLMQQAPAAAVMDAVAQLAGRELQTITVVAPAVFTPTAAMLVIEPFAEPSPPVDLTTTLAITVPPASEVSIPVVTVAANLRSGPSIEANVVGQIGAGAEITIAGRNSDGSWYQLDDGSWVVGFVVDDAPPALPIVVDGMLAITQTVPATVTGGALILRAGPSRTDNSLGTYEGGTVTAVLTRSPDGNWLQVLMRDGKTGWMSADFLDVADSLEDLPAVISTESLAITGQVVDGAGEGIGGIVVAATHTGGGPVPRVDVTTASDGAFTLYMRPGGETEWTVQIAGVGCDSRIVNDRCQLFGYYAAVPQVDVVLPSEEPVTLAYADATSFIAGTVLDAEGNPVGDDVRVSAAREDGARTFGLTSSTGKFVLPAADGMWTVSTQNGPSVEVEVPEKSAPEPIELALE